MAEPTGQTAFKRRRRIRRTVHFGEPLPPGAHTFRAAWLCGPALVWVTMFMLVPLLFVVALSFAQRGDAGEIVWRFTWENYERLFGHGSLGFDPVQPLILARSLGVGFATAGLCLLIGLPVAFFIASLPRRWKSVALTLVVIPFWTNLLIRTYAWQLLLSPEGWLADILTTAGMIPAGTALYPGWPAVMVAMVCDYLPFMILPLYASVEKLDWLLAEAAADLGASPGRMFWHAVVPQIRPGMIAGGVLVFLPATGQFVIPDLLGGAKLALLGNAVQQQFGSSRDWPFGSAIAVVALLVMVAGLWLHTRVTNGRREVSLP
ncbi:MAG: ABC transporter permease [Verrucomicrobia bacterium]|nr:ABC transporter permease [Verrucomicrobiota bacterium]NBU08815.1 ABC transporter permease [Pseudomonadota bacterium]NDB75843.1 ABC transporter permease [Verrucomicrobiota bacterium]